MSDCDTCNGVEPSTLNDEEFAEFCELKTKEGAIPAGKISYVTGETLFIDGGGKALDSEAYIAAHGFDPAPIWDRIKAWQAETGRLKNPTAIGRIRLPKREPVKLGRIGRL